jgi:hypothetical protein
MNGRAAHSSRLAVLRENHPCLGLKNRSEMNCPNGRFIFATFGRTQQAFRTLIGKFLNASLRCRVGAKLRDPPCHRRREALAQRSFDLLPVLSVGNGGAEGNAPMFA